MTKPTHPRYWPTPQGRDCYDWISAEDVIRHALSAYYYVCREYDQVPDDPQPFDLLHKHGRRELAESIGELFGMRLMEQGFRVSAPGFSSSAALWLANRYNPSPESISSTPEALSGPDFPNIRKDQDIHCEKYLGARKGAGGAQSR